MIFVYKQKETKSRYFLIWSLFAVWTGLEPATPCVTGRYSNQLNYHTVCVSIGSANIEMFLIFTKFLSLFSLNLIREKGEMDIAVPLLSDKVRIGREVV